MVKEGNVDVVLLLERKARLVEMLMEMGGRDAFEKTESAARAQQAMNDLKKNPLLTQNQPPGNYELEIIDIVIQNSLG